MVDVMVVKLGFHLDQMMVVVKAESMVVKLVVDWDQKMVVKLVVHLDQMMVVMTAGLMVVMME